MRLFVITTFLIALIILCDRNIAQGALIKKDVSQHPIHISAGNITTWQKDGVKIFSAEGNVKIEQGDIQITSDSTITWFSEIKITQFTEGVMEIYCEGNVSIFQDGDIQNYQQMYLKLTTTAGVVVDSKDSSIQSFEEEKKTELYLQGEKIRAEGREEFASTEVPQAGVPSESVSVEGEPIDIVADDIDTWLENDVRVIVAIGNVKIKRGDDTLNADNVILYFDQEKGKEGKSPKQIYKEVYAEGNVTLRRKDDLIIAEKIFENIKEKKGIFIDSTISNVIKPPVVRVPTPAYIKGDEIRHSKGNYEIKNGDFSLCSYGHPHYRFNYSKLRIVKTGEHSILTSKKNVFYVGKVPLMYLPYLNFNLKKNAKRLEEWETGRTTRFGRFVETDWDVYGFAFGEKMDDWSDLTLSADFLELRGPGAGLDFEYAKPNYYGYANTYYINDEEDFDINNVPVPQEDRGHFLWRHRQTFFNDWIADIEISQVSDRSYFREYYQQEFKMEKDRTTLLYLRKLSDNRGITFLAEHQLRTYDTLIDSVRLSRKNESFPELKYRIIGEPLWDGKLNFTSETELVYQNRLFDRIPPLKSDENFLGRGDLLTAERVFDRVPVRFEPEETIRFDTNNMLNAPFQLWRQRFNPFIGIRFTGYSESVKEDPVTGRNEGSGTPRGRIAIPIGINTSTTLSRTYSIYNKFLNINRLRHIMVPELSLNFIPVVTQEPEDLNQFDGIDAIDTYQAIKLGLRNRLQTKRGEPGKEKTVDIVDFNTEFNFFPGNAGLNRKRDDFIELYLKVKLTDRVSFLSEGNEFNLRKGGIDILNTRLRYITPKWNISIGNRFIDNTSSTIIFSSNVSLNEKWGVSFHEQYDFKTQQKDKVGRGTDFESQSLYAAVTVTRYFHDWLARMNISQIGTREDDNIVTFDIVPRGIGATTTRLRSLGLLLPEEERQ